MIRYSSDRTNPLTGKPFADELNLGTIVTPKVYSGRERKNGNIWVLDQTADTLEDVLFEHWTKNENFYSSTVPSIDISYRDNLWKRDVVRKLFKNDVNAYNDYIRQTDSLNIPPLKKAINDTINFLRKAYMNTFVQESTKSTIFNTNVEYQNIENEFLTAVIELAFSQSFQNNDSLRGYLSGINCLLDGGGIVNRYMELYKEGRILGNETAFTTLKQEIKAKSDELLKLINTILDKNRNNETELNSDIRDMLKLIEIFKKNIGKPGFKSVRRSKINKSGL